MPIEKIEELGAHFHKYYQLETSFYKSSLDNEILDRLWNEYWIATLSSSPLLNNQKQITNTIVDVNSKIKKVAEQTGSQSVKVRAGQNRRFNSSLINMDGMPGSSGSYNKPGLSAAAFEGLTKIASDASKVACECNHGLMVETLKKFMF